MDGCLTWLSEGFEDLGLALYPERKAANEGGRELTLLVTVWGWTCLKTELWLSLHSPPQLLHSPFPDAGGGLERQVCLPSLTHSPILEQAAFPALTSSERGWRWWPHILGPARNRYLLNVVSH